MSKLLAYAVAPPHGDDHLVLSPSREDQQSESLDAHMSWVRETAHSRESVEWMRSLRPAQTRKRKPPK